VPYVIGIVEFPDLGGIRLISNIVDAPADELRLGLPLELIWGEAENGTALPWFTVAS
jgi:uncharacterized OB-fold protein